MDLQNKLERFINEAKTPESVYNERSKEIQKMLKSIDKKLKAHRKVFEKDSTNWGAASDLGFIVDQIKAVDEFIVNR